MRYTTTIILMVLAAGLAAYVYFVEPHTRTTPEVEAERSKLVPRFERDRVTRIAIARPGAAELVLERQPGKDEWRITAPQAALADSSSVSEILSAVEFLEFRAKVSDPGARSRAEYGVAQPRVTLRLRAGGKDVVLAAGNDDASGQGVYATRGDEPTVYVVEKRFREAIDRDLGGVRDRRLLAFDSGKARGLRLGDAALAKESGGWSFTAPRRIRATDGKVQDFLQALSGIRVTRFVTAGAEVGGRRIAVIDDAEHAITLGGACPGYPSEVLAMRGAPDPGGVCLGKTDAERLAVEPDALRDLRLLTIRPEDARAITINVEGRELKLAREGEAWKVTAPAGATADDEVIRRWLEDLGSYRALKVETGDPAAYGLAAGKGGAPIRVTVQGEGGASVAVTMSAARDGRRWARRGDEPALLQVHSEPGDMMSADPLFFRSRKVLAITRWEVKTVSLAAGGTTEVAERQGEGWRLQQPIAIEADAGVMDRLLGALAELRAEKYLAQVPPTAFARPYAFRVSTQPAEPEAGRDAGARKAETHALEVGGDAPSGGCFARSGALQFTLARGVCEDLRVHLASRKLLDLGDQPLAAIALVRGGKTETLEKRGPSWHRAAGPEVPAEKVDEVIAALRGLTAKDVAGYGAAAGQGLQPPRLEVGVRPEGGKEQKVLIGAAAEGGVYARLVGREVTYVLPRTAVEALEKLAP